MGFATVPILGVLLILVGIYKRRENYGKMFFVIGSLLLLASLLICLYASYGFGVVL